jgi:hypothetical protein
MKNIVRFAMVAVLAVSLLAGFTPANAALQSYTSGFQVQNLEATTANITIHFYNRDGSEAITGGVSDTIDPNGSNTYFPLDTTGGLPGTVPDGFDGSVVIKSTTQVAAITNILGSDEGGDTLAYGASYSGFTSGSTDAYLPLLMYANYGYTTWHSVQNLGAAATDITVEYSDGISETVENVAPGAAAKFEQSLEGHASGWVGSATISADQPVAATALEVGDTTLFAYDSFVAGSVNPAMPLVNENNYGYVTGIQVQNAGVTETEVTLSYVPSQAGTACTETRTVPAGQSVTFALYAFTTYGDPNPGSLVGETCTAGETFIGSGSVISNTANAPVMAIVNQLNSGSNKGAAYNAFDPGAGTARVVLPLLMDRNYGYWTGFSIVNVGTTTIPAGGMVCDFTGAPANISNTAALAPGQAWTVQNNNNLGDGYVGSADCNGPAGSMVVAIVNELNTGSTKDAFLVYEGTNP